VNTHTEAIKFTQQFDNPNFKIILDTKAMCSMGKPIPEIIRESKGEFAYYHANDENLKGPGFGEVDFVPIGEALRDVGYDGVVSVEVFDFEEGPEVIATQSLANLKEAFGV
jgi:sugar phosphate isomerase/epimerase